MTEWLIVIGTISLALIAFLQDRIRSFYWSPKLECNMELRSPDCHRTVSIFKTPVTEVIGKQLYSYYYRFKIWNEGNITAKNVELLITEVLVKEGDKYKILESFSPDNLVWSTTGKIYAPTYHLGNLNR